MELLALAIFGVALSLDGFAAGFAYGLRQVRIPFFSLLIICLTSGAAISISLGTGYAVAQFVTPSVARVLGGVLLVLLGFWILSQALRRSAHDGLSIRIPPFGLVINILFEPLDADTDQSGVICPREAAVLGIALSLDALAAGFAVSLSGLYSPHIPLFVTGGLFTLISAGMFIGERSYGFGNKVNLLPGLLLIMLGVFRLV